MYRGRDSDTPVFVAINYALFEQKKKRIYYFEVHETFMNLVRGACRAVRIDNRRYSRLNAAYNNLQ